MSTVDCSKLTDTNIQVTAIDGGHNNPDKSTLHIYISAQGRKVTSLVLSRDQFAELCSDGLELLHTHNQPE